MFSLANVMQWILASLLIFSSLGVILARNPVYACLSFLLTLLTLAVFYLQLSAEFIAVMQVLIYAGAILVIFMFVIVLFQDAYQNIHLFPAQSTPWLIFLAIGAFLVSMVFLGSQLLGFKLEKVPLPEHYGTVELLGEALYLDFFFPFEAIILLFLVAVVGTLYIGKKGE